MKICDHVTEKCFEPAGPWKAACPHAVSHDITIGCLGSQCQRFAKEDDVGKLQGVVWIKHVEM